MNYGKGEALKLKTIIILSIISLVLAGLIFNGIKKSSLNEYSPISGFYSKIIEYTIPIVKANSLNEQEYKDKGVLKKSIAKVLGINSVNSIHILGKEMSYIAADKSYANQIGLNEFNDEHMINRFYLSSDQVYEEPTVQKHNGNMDSAPSFSSNLKKKMSSKPEVLIYHTHSCEGYDGKISQFDQEKSVTVVGEKLKEELEKYGIKTINDTTIHDIKDYNNSYKASRKTLINHLKKYGDFKIIIDMHRDSIWNKDAVTTSINGQKVARFEFVMTKGNNFRFKKQEKLVKKLRDISNNLYPGDKNNTSFNKSTYYYEYGRNCFNQDLNDKAVLIEVGSVANTLEEAKTSTKYLARIIAEHLNGKN